MTYKELFDLKFKKRISTYELVCLYPQHLKQVSEVALLEIPDETLRTILPQKSVLRRLRMLKSKFMGVRRKASQ